MEDINNRLEKLEKRVEMIVEMLERIETNTKKMSEHIDFVDGVYENVKSPMEWICNKINLIDYRDKKYLEEK